MVDLSHGAFFHFGPQHPGHLIDVSVNQPFGVFQGWIVIGFLLILLMFVPLPQGFVKALDTSLLAPMMRGTIPFIYEESAPLHPQSPDFIKKVEKALDVDPVGSSKQGGEDVVMQEMDRAQEIIEYMKHYFGS